MKDLFTPASLLGPGNNNARTCPNLAALADKGDPLVMVADQNLALVEGAGKGNLTNTCNCVDTIDIKHTKTRVYEYTFLISNPNDGNVMLMQKYQLLDITN